MDKRGIGQGQGLHARRIHLGTHDEERCPRERLQFISFGQRFPRPFRWSNIVLGFACAIVHCRPWLRRPRWLTNSIVDHGRRHLRSSCSVTPLGQAHGGIDSLGSSAWTRVLRSGCPRHLQASIPSQSSGPFDGPPAPDSPPLSPLGRPPSPAPPPPPDPPATPADEEVYIKLASLKLEPAAVEWVGEGSSDHGCAA